MTRAELLDEMKKVITPYLTDEDKLKLDNLTEETSFINDLKLDSVDLVDIVISTESRFGIQIENESIAKMLTVGKCLDIVEAKIAEKTS